MQSIGHATHEQQCIVPHARTLRKAREQVRQMVASGVSPRRIKSYLLAWCTWWRQTAGCWTKKELLAWFLEVCWDESAATIATSLPNSLSKPAHGEDLKRHRL